MKIIKLLFSRTVQTLGNLVKVMFFVHYALLPRQRFLIPRFSKPILARNKKYDIPRIIWQTNYTRSVTLPVYFNYLWNRLMAPTFEYHCLVDDEVLRFIESNFNADILGVFNKLKIGASKADYWRALVLLKKGGIYLDVDAAFCIPPAFFLAKGRNELFIFPTGKPITNFFLAAMPNHPEMTLIASKIKENIEQKNSDSVFELTGPTVVDRIVKGSTCAVAASNVVCRQGLFVQKKYQYPDKTNVHWVEGQRNGSIFNE